MVRVLPEETVLTIFWTLPIVGPMLDEGGANFPRPDPIRLAPQDKSK